MDSKRRDWITAAIITTLFGATIWGLKIGFGSFVLPLIVAALLPGYLPFYPLYGVHGDPPVAGVLALSFASWTVIFYVLVRIRKRLRARFSRRR